jgi:hypothetical protein
MHRRKHKLGAFATSLVCLAALACSSPPPTPPPASAPTTGILKAVSEPTSATVLLDGKPGCTPTPCEIQSVSFGPHELIFQHPEYEDLTRKVKFSAENPEVSASLKTESKPKIPGKVKLIFEKEKPEKIKALVEVVITGQEEALVLSDTLEFELAPGKKSLEIRRAGFTAITREVEVTSGGNAEIQIIKADLVGAKLTLIIDSNPVKGKVTVNGKDKGLAPVTVAELDASKAHSVVIKADTYEDFKSNIKWTKGPYEMKVNALLSQGGASGFFVVDTKPLTGMIIYVDGKKTKYTTPISSPGIKLPAGTHKINFEAGGKKSADFNVTIEEGKTLSKAFKIQ